MTAAVQSAYTAVEKAVTASDITILQDDLMLKPLQRTELKRTYGLEANSANIACLGRNIRSPRVHVLLSLTATCQLCLVSRRVGRSIYIQYN